MTVWCNYIGRWGKCTKCRFRFNGRKFAMAVEVVRIGHGIREVICYSPNLTCAGDEEKLHLRSFDKPIHDCEAFHVV